MRHLCRLFKLTRPVERNPQFPSTKSDHCVLKDVKNHPQITRRTTKFDAFSTKNIVLPKRVGAEKFNKFSFDDRG
jgi:hypothetical protein